MELNEKSKILDTEPSTGANTPTEVTSDTYQLIDAQDGASGDGVKRSTLPMATFNFINSVIGSGIIGMPYALKQAGVGLGVILIILVAIITDYSVMLLIHGGQISNTNSYQGLVQSAFGRPGFFVLTIMQFLYPFIAMVSYNVIIGDTITKVLLRFFGYYISGTIVGTRHFVIIVVTLLILLPVSLYRDISKLAVASLASIVFVIFILVAMIIRTGISAEIPVAEDSWQFANYNFTQAIGVMAFAYMCLHNSFLIYDSLEDPTWHKWHIVTHASMLTSMVLMVVLGIVGYATFTSLTQGDILENYCEMDDLMNAARIAFAVTIMMTYPVECFVTREVLEHSVFAHYQPRTLWRHSLVTVVIVCLTVVFSMATDCLGVVLELNGVLAAAPLAFIIPPACVIKLQHDPVLCVKNIPMLLTTAFGILVMGMGTAMVIKELVEGYNCSHGELLKYCQEVNMTGLFVNQSSVLTTSMPVEL